MWSIQCKCHYINTTQLTDTIDWSLRFPFSFAFAFAFSFNFGFCANIFQFRWKSIFIATKVVNISVEFVAIPSRGNVEQDYSCVLASHDSTFDDVCVCFFSFITSTNYSCFKCCNIHLTKWHMHSRRIKRYFCFYVAYEQEKKTNHIKVVKICCGKKQLWNSIVEREKTTERKCYEMKCSFCVCWLPSIDVTSVTKWTVFFLFYVLIFNKWFSGNFGITVKTEQVCDDNAWTKANEVFLRIFYRRIDIKSEHKIKYKKNTHTLTHSLISSHSNLNSHTLHTTSSGVRIFHLW